jgi:hypothetical protein
VVVVVVVVGVAACVLVVVVVVVVVVVGVPNGGLLAGMVDVGGLLRVGVFTAPIGLATM